MEREEAMSASHKPRWALAILCAGTLMVIVDQTIVSVALPVIKADLGLSEAALSWVVNGYVIPFGGFLLISGRLGDLLGHRRLFVAGLALFTLASLGCGLSGTAPALIGARVVQGIGGSMLTAVSLGMIVELFPAVRARAKALGVFSFVQAAGGSLGSLLGGVLTQVVSWPWIFLINVPIGVVTLIAAFRLLSADRPARSVRSGRPLRILRSRMVLGANAVLALLTASMFAFLFFGTLYLRETLRYDALHTGLALVPIAVAIGAVSLGLSARLNGRFGERPVLLAGLALIAAGLLLLNQGTTFWAATLLMGIGFGAAMPALMTLGMSAATAEDAGLAGGIFNTSQQLGGALGLAVLSAVTTDYRLTFLLGAALTIAALLLAAITLRSQGAETPRAPDPRGIS
jgi:MFS family permease